MRSNAVREVSVYYSATLIVLRTSNPRPVLLPVGPLARLCVAFLSCTADEQIEGHVDPVVRALETSIVPKVWEFGCNLTEGLANWYASLPSALVYNPLTFVRSARIHLVPHLSQLLFHVTRHLEGSYPPYVDALVMNQASTHAGLSARRISFLRAASVLLDQCPALNDPMLPSRLARAALPLLTALLALQSQAQREDDVNGPGVKGRKGKKRARGYEGDEVFKTREVACPSKEDGDVVIAALDGKLFETPVKLMTNLSSSHPSSCPELFFERRRAIHHRSYSSGALRCSPPGTTQPILPRSRPVRQSLWSCAAHLHRNWNRNHQYHEQKSWPAYRKLASRVYTYSQYPLSAAHFCRPLII